MGSIVLEYNSNKRNQERLKEVSLDDVSGIDTMINNINMSSNVVIPVFVLDENPKQIDSSSNLSDLEEISGPFNVEQINEPIPNVQVTVIPKEKLKVSEVNELKKQVNKLTDKQKNSIIFGLLGLSLILIAIAIFK